MAEDLFNIDNLTEDIDVEAKRAGGRYRDGALYRIAGSETLDLVQNDSIQSPSSGSTGMRSVDDRSSFPHLKGSSPHLEASSPHSENSLPHSEDSLPHSEDSLPHSKGSLPHLAGSLLHLKRSSAHSDGSSAHISTTEDDRRTRETQ